MLASIMAKKASVGATHLLLDLPVGPGSKLLDQRRAIHLQRKFAVLGRRLGIKVLTMVTDGSEPIGNGIGPGLEARDCLWVLENDPRGPADLRQKSIDMAALLLEMTGKAKVNHGHELASRLVRDGSALRAMQRMIRAQGGKPRSPGRILVGPLSYAYRASRSGVVVGIDNVAVTRIARLAGAPRDKGSGILLHKHVGSRVRKGEPVFTIFAHNAQELRFARDAVRKYDGVRIR
jgi:thymidine phosphorylase